MILRALLAAVLAVVSASALLAQSPAVDRRVTLTDLRIQASLKNGATIVGIAPGGCLAERLSQRGYEAADDVSDRKTGVRIWYYRNMDGFLFVPYRTVKDLEILGALEPIESKVLRDV